MPPVDDRLAPRLKVYTNPPHPLDGQVRFDSLIVNGNAYLFTSVQSSEQSRVTVGSAFLDMPQHVPHAHHQRLSDTSYDTPPHSNRGDGGEVEQPETHPPQTPPRGYTVRPLQWFRPGRMFSIWDPNNEERHLKEYVLLDTRNIDGTCLLVEGQEAEHSHEEHDEADFQREHVRVRNWAHKSDSDQDPDEQTVFLSRFDKRNVDDDTWVHLERTYNIPFARLACREHSILERTSLIALRRFYLCNLAYTWDLTDIVRAPASLS